MGTRFQEPDYHDALGHELQALRHKQVKFFTDQVTMGSLSMRSLWMQ